MKKEIAEKILLETESGYDLISKKFSQTRKHFWRGLEFIKDYTHEGDIVLDFGCGNGRLLELVGEIKGIKYLGVDVSGQLIELAKAKYCLGTCVCHSGLDPESSKSHQLAGNLDSRFHGNDRDVCFQKIDPSQSTIALENDFFNTIYSIAVFHHFPSKEYRQAVANELFAKTKKDGTIVVTVWYLWPSFASLRRGKPAFVSLRRGKQKKYFKNILKNWLGKLKGESALDFNDCKISFTDNAGVKVERFHHAFTKGELRKLFEFAGFKTQKCEIVDGRNILYIGKKE